MKSFILFFVLSTPLFARLGETMEQCVERYGKPTKVTEKTYFLKSGVTISVKFHLNKVISIHYHRKDSKLTKSEIESLMAANIPDTEINLIESNPNTYQDKNGRYRILEGNNMTYLLIVDVEGSSQLRKIESAKEKAEAEKSLEGF